MWLTSLKGSLALSSLDKFWIYCLWIYQAFGIIKSFFCVAYVAVFDCPLVVVCIWG